MFQLDLWLEIFNTFRKNKLRTILTGFSVFWGIFILIILLGSGEGLKHAVESGYSGAKNRISLSGGRTSKAYAGYKVGRSINITLTDFQLLKSKIRKLAHICPLYNMWSNGVTYKKELVNFNQISGTVPDIIYTMNFEMTMGRNLNDNDIKNSNKCIIINEYARKLLFKDEDCLGKFLKISNIPFQVIGVYNNDTRWVKSNPLGIVPISVVQKIFNAGINVHFIDLDLKDVSSAESFSIVQDMRKLLSPVHQVDPTDESAMYITNVIEEYAKSMMLIYIIKLFVLLIGIGTIIAGVVGVSNIMII